nr:MAG: major capsid protein [Microviridae sp.]WNN13341.1 MAG: major capsid protein [Microviridae sp.]
MSRRIRVSQGHFSQVPNVTIGRSKFNRSHVLKTTFDEGKLIPIFVDEVLPGDSFKLKVTTFTRMATPIFPVMDNLYLDTFFFFVPMRLIWDNFQKFMGEQENPGDSTDFLIPTYQANNTTAVDVGTLGDYFGLPTVANVPFNILPFRAYWLIWNEWFRDENLQDSAPVSKADAGEAWSESKQVNGFNWYECAPRGKRYDYFTSCLPWPQKGPGVELPLGGSAPVIMDMTTDVNEANYQGYIHKVLGSSTTSDNPTWNNNTRDTFTINGAVSSYNGFNNHPIVADLSQASAATINSLRQAFQLQRYYEKDARGGTRYIEKIKSHFGVTSPDARLQRPEYLGGHTDRININPVVQTSSTDSTSPQGNLSAFGVSGARYHGFSKSFVEHGYIIGLAHVRADLTYQQGINKMWSRKTVLDFYWPSFAHLGEQAVLNKEIFAQGTSKDDEVFGYQERYGEYRYKPSMITGKFRSTFAQSLDAWHFSQKFENLPTLSNQFIQDHAPISRCLAVPSEPHFLMDAAFNLQCVRPMPLFGTPGLIDHF